MIKPENMSTDGMGCDRHPDAAFSLVATMDGCIHVHRHVGIPEMTAALGELVEQLHAYLLTEACE